MEVVFLGMPFSTISPAVSDPIAAVRLPQAGFTFAPGSLRRKAREAGPAFGMGANRAKRMPSAVCGLDHGGAVRHVERHPSSLALLGAKAALA